MKKQLLKTTKFSLICMCMSFTSLAQINVVTGGKVGVGTSSPGEKVEVKTADATVRIWNSNDAGGGFAGDTWSTMQFGIFNPSGSAFGVVAAGDKRSFFGFDKNGKVGSLTNLYGSPTFRNLLDDGSGNVGIGTTSPTKPLDIAASGGIRISRTDTASSNNEIVFSDNGQIKSVDNNHRIIFYRGVGGTSINILELREYGDIIFSPGATGGNRTQTVTFKSGGNVGIGTTSPSSLFSVGGSGNSLYKAYVNNSSSTNGGIGIYSTIATPGSGGSTYCMYGAMTCGVGYGYGFKGSSYSSSTTTGAAIGVYGQAGNATSGLNWGVAGVLLGSRDGAGIYGSDRYGLLESTGGNYAGYFHGKIKTTQDSAMKPTTGSWTGYSDVRLKKDTAAFKDGLEVLRKVRPMTYKFTGVGGLPSVNTNIGVIAQDLQKVAPYCVGKGTIVVKQSETSSFGSDVISSAPDTGGVGQSLVKVFTYNYDGLIYVLINSVKQLDSTVTDLRKQLSAKAGQKTATANQDSTIKALQKQIDNFINNCCNKTGQNNATQNNILGGQKAGGNQLATSGNLQQPKLEQNNPNPFNQSTSIKCFIPDVSKSASLLILDMNGTLKKTILLNGKGEVNTIISAKELIAGMYFYTLIIDGSEIDTKKMILTEQ